MKWLDRLLGRQGDRPPNRNDDQDLKRAQREKRQLEARLAAIRATTDVVGRRGH
jgi:hypothetical protein